MRRGFMRLLTLSPTRSTIAAAFAMAFALALIVPAADRIGLADNGSDTSDDGGDGGDDVPPAVAYVLCPSSAVAGGLVQVRRDAGTGGNDTGATPVTAPTGTRLTVNDALLTAPGGWAVLVFVQRGVTGATVVGGNREFRLDRALSRLQADEDTLVELPATAIEALANGCELIARTVDDVDGSGDPDGNDDPTGAVTLLAPRGLVSQARPKIAWSAQPGAQGYRLTFVGDGEGFFEPFETDVASARTAVAWPETLPALTPGVSVNVTVDALDENGDVFDDGGAEGTPSASTRSAEVFLPFTASRLDAWREAMSQSLEAATALGDRLIASGASRAQADAMTTALAPLIRAHLALAELAWGEALLELGRYLDAARRDAQIRTFARRMGRVRLDLSAAATDHTLAVAATLAPDDDE